MSTHTASTHPFHKLRTQFDKLLVNKSTRTYILVTLFVLLTIVTLAIVAILLRTRTDVSVGSQVATLSLSPVGGSLTPGTTQTISLKANIALASVDGIQVFIDFTGAVPTNLTFQGSTIPKLSLVTGSVSNSTNGKTLSLLFITEQPTVPFTASGDFELGKLTFTVPASGQMVATFNSSLTKVIDHSDSTNIVTVPAASTYTFAAPTSTSSSSSTITTTTSVSTTTTSTGPCAGATGNYYNNITLTGAPVLTRCDTTIDFDWGTGSPGVGVNADNFSARWETTTNFATAGTYRFTAYSDDGKRIYVDGALLMDNWVNQSGDVPVVATKVLTAGNHTIRVEYYESTGSAEMKVNVELVTSSSASSSTTTSSSASTTTTTTVSTTTSTGGGLACAVMDVDDNKFLDITDFAAFAANYNKACVGRIESGTGQVFDYQPGQTVELDIKLTNQGANNAVEVDLLTSNATVLSFIPTTATGWLGAIGYCTPQGAQILAPNRVCTAMSKQTDIIAGEIVGKVRVQFGAAGTATVDRTSAFAYSNGTTKVPNPGNLYTLSVGVNTPDTNICGGQDANVDNFINVIDFSVLGRRYRKANCGV